MKLTPLEQCENLLIEKLENMKSLGIINHALCPHDRSSEFEILEFYGDSVLYERISAFFMQTRRFMNPHLLTELRKCCISNNNLANIFEKLQIGNLLLHGYNPNEFLKPKQKADVVESLIGELAEALNNQEHSSVSTKVRSTLQDLLAFICYLGEQIYFATTSAATNNTSYPSSPSSKAVPSMHGTVASLPSPAKRETRAPSPPTKLDKPYHRASSSISPPKNQRQMSPPKHVSFSESPQVFPIPPTYDDSMTHQKYSKSKKPFTPRRILASPSSSTPLTHQPTTSSTPLTHQPTTSTTVHKPTPHIQILRRPTTTESCSLSTLNVGSKLPPQQASWEELVQWSGVH